MSNTVKISKETVEIEDTFVINHGAIIQWFQSLPNERQDEWIQEVTGIDSAVVTKYELTEDISDSYTLEITFMHLQ